MNKLCRVFYKYFYTIFAACCIGIGSGFVSFLPFLSDYEERTNRATYELEQATGLNYSNGIDCKNYSEVHADCNYVHYLNEALSGFNKLIIEQAFFYLSLTAIIFFVLGLFCHLNVLTKSAHNPEIN